jgi:hypothetical protein
LQARLLFALLLAAAVAAPTWLARRQLPFGTTNAKRAHSACATSGCPLSQAPGSSKQAINARSLEHAPPSQLHTPIDFPDPASALPLALTGTPIDNLSPQSFVSESHLDARNWVIILTPSLIFTYSRQATSTNTPAQSAKLLLPRPAAVSPANHHRLLRARLRHPFLLSDSPTPPAATAARCTCTHTPIARVQPANRRRNRDPPSARHHLLGPRPANADLFCLMP